MGLLTDPKKRQKIINIIRKYNQKICIVLYIAGVVGFLALAYQPFNAGIYFSENALLPGLVENEFYLDSDATSYNEQLKVEMKKSDRALPKEWMFTQFQDLGLETYHHNFSLHYPFGMPKDKAIPGQNIYAILRAKRTASTESVVMSVPLRHSGVLAEEQTSGGIAVMLALAKHFKKQTYWAKDIMFVLTEYDEIGMQAWLDGYHQSESEYIISDDLPARSGPIQAAINLEIPGENIQSYNIKLEGLNGQLPNLDLSNLVVRLCRKEMAKVTFNKQADAHKPETTEGYKQSLITMLYMMWNQASGTPTGNHGLFHRYHIEALTLQGIQEKRGRMSHGVKNTARLVEGIFRSLNNLLERFHQSFFFYILPSTDRYVSIGLYMPPFGLMIAASLIKAIALWIGADSKQKRESSKDKEEKTENKEVDQSEITDDKDVKSDDVDVKSDDKDVKSDDKDVKSDDKDVKSDDKDVKSDDKDVKSDNKDVKSDDKDVKSDEDDDGEDKPITGVSSIIPVIAISMLMALLAYTGPQLLTSVSNPFRLRPEDALIFGLLALFCASLAFPKMFNKKNPDQISLQLDWQLLKCIALIVQSLTLFSVALMNISLAFFIGALMVPVTTFVAPTKSRMLYVFQLVLLLLVSPVSLVTISSVISALLDNYSDYMDLLHMIWANVKHCVFMKLLDLYLFGNWTYTVMSFLIFPCWLFFWAIPNCTTDNDK